MLWFSGNRHEVNEKYDDSEEKSCFLSEFWLTHVREDVKKHIFNGQADHEGFPPTPPLNGQLFTIFPRGPFDLMIISDVKTFLTKNKFYNALCVKPLRNLEFKNFAKIANESVAIQTGCIKDLNQIEGTSWPKPLKKYWKSVYNRCASLIYTIWL